MINNIQRPQCYNAFYSAKTSSNNFVHNKVNDASLGLKATTFATSLACATLVTYCIARKQSKLSNKKINIFNVMYSETDMLKVAFSSLAGGTIMGLALDNKKYVKPKLQEALHQAVANIACPLLLVLGLNKGYEKISSNIKMFQFKETSQIMKGINIALNILPNLALTCVGLASGVLAGTKISNVINKQINDDYVDRKIKPLDFCYHPDDIAAALVLADKQGGIQRVVGRILPPVFALHGFEAGSKRTNVE